jgi:hypothetical protein
MSCSTVQVWLTHDDIFNLELTPSANRDTNDKIITSLQESALADDPAHAVGEKRQVDLLEASARAATRRKLTNRPLKNPVAPAPGDEPTVPPSEDESAPTSTAAPPRAPSRLLVQYLASGTDPRVTGAAATRAADLLASLTLACALSGARRRGAAR